MKSFDLNERGRPARPALSLNNSCDRNRWFFTSLECLAQGQLAGEKLRSVKRFVSHRRSAPRSCPDLDYVRLLLERYAAGLLGPFECSRCGRMALDPIGWNGPGKPLCPSCADGNGKEEGEAA